MSEARSPRDETLRMAAGQQSKPTEHVSLDAEHHPFDIRPRRARIEWAPASADGDLLDKAIVRDVVPLLERNGFTSFSCTVMRYRMPEDKDLDLIIMVILPDRIEEAKDALPVTISGHAIVVLQGKTSQTSDASPQTSDASRHAMYQQQPQPGASLSADGLITAGTFGVYLFDISKEDVVYGLTAAHVLKDRSLVVSPSDKDADTTRMLYEKEKNVIDKFFRESYDTGEPRYALRKEALLKAAQIQIDENQGDRTFGERVWSLERCEPDARGCKLYMDLAIFECKSERVPDLPNYVTTFGRDAAIQRTVSSPTRAHNAGLHVAKNGRQTGYTTGRLNHYWSKLRFEGAVLGSDLFAAQVIIGDLGGPFSRGGDSGSVIFTEDTTLPYTTEAVGMLFGASEINEVWQDMCYYMPWLSIQEMLASHGFALGLEP